jgi:ribosome-binding protein aMBF1 (putative translation factor)
MRCPVCEKKAKYGLYRIKIDGDWVAVCDKCRDEHEAVADKPL